MAMAAVDLKLNSTSFCEKGNLNKIVNLNPTLRPLAISEIPPLQAAFLIDHILEKIFSKLDTVSVKSCRLVSPRWKEFGAIELQKRVSINLAFAFVSVEDAQNHNGDGDQVLLNCCLPQPLSSPSADNTTANSLFLPNLLSLIEHSTTNFPCDTFVISTETLGSSQMQNILSTIGLLMRKLRLSVILYSQKSSFQENSLLHDLKRLLSVQAPFLKSFDLKVKLPYHWKEEMAKADFNLNFLKSNSSPVPGKMYLPNLKSLTLLDELPYSFCHEILDSAVNLTELYGTHFGTYFTEQNGKYRIHLLRHLHFAMYSDSQFEILTQLLRQNRNNLKLESIRMTVTKSFFEDGVSTSRERQQSSSVHMLNDLLETNAKTLKKLTLEPLRSLPGIRIPQMRELQSLVLVYYKVN